MVVPSSSPPPFTFVKGHGHGLAWSGNSIETSSSVTAETLRTPDDVKTSHTNAATVKSSADVQNGKAVEAISMDEEAQRRVSGAVFSDSDEEMLKNGMPLDDDGNDEDEDEDDDEGEGEAQHRVENGCSEAENELLKRRVQWNDSHGKELVHVLEFETSDTCDSDDNDDDESQTCTCTIQ